MEEIIKHLDKLIILIITLGTVYAIKAIDNTKAKKATTAENKCTDGKHCGDHPQVVKDIGKIKVDTEVTKNNVEWIREKLEGK